MVNKIICNQTIHKKKSKGDGSNKPILHIYYVLMGENKVTE